MVQIEQLKYPWWVSSWGWRTGLTPPRRSAGPWCLQCWDWSEPTDADLELVGSHGYEAPLWCSLDFSKHLRWWKSWAPCPGVWAPDPGRARASWSRWACRVDGSLEILLGIPPCKALRVFLGHRGIVCNFSNCPSQSQARHR